MAMRRRVFLGVALAVTLAFTLPAGPRAATAVELPARLSDAEFWKLIEDFSEPNGSFRSDNLLSNEIWFQTIIPELLTFVKPGGVYMGVGPEQNFTYIAALKPRMVFIVDVRRGNLHTQLMYKALFELAADRADFVSMLFARKRPDGLTAGSTVQDIFAAVSAAPASEDLYKEHYKKLTDHLTKTRSLPVPQEDLAGIDYVYSNFFTYGPSINYNSSTSGGFGRAGTSYQALMTTTDSAGQTRSYLASEALFGVMKELETKNLVVPLVGDFAGPKAIRSVGKYLKERESGAIVSAFYLSNVEQYLVQGGLWQSFCNNVASLPLSEHSTFIYSQGGGGGGRGGGGGLASWYRPMLSEVKAASCTASVPARTGAVR
jgi:hypothetical protein